MFSGFRVYPCSFTTLVCQMMRKHPAGLSKYIICKAMIAVRWMLFVRLLKQVCKHDPIFLVAVHLALPCFPFVVAGSIHFHKFAEKLYRILHFELFDDFVFSALPVAYTLFAPTPSTQYPFFNRAISISCLATISLSRSTSLKDLLVCSAAYGLPLRETSASSPPSRYFFTHVDTRPLLTEYSFSICMSDL